MKRLSTKISYAIYIVLSVFFLSCKSEGEKEYTKQYWKYRTKTLEIEYVERLNRLKSSAELDKTIIWVDSVMADY